MKRGFWKVSLFGGLVLSVVGLTRCFSPDLPTCAYRCYGSEPACPDEYECRQDGYCHLKGTTEACPFMMPPDLRGGDLSARDLANPDAGTDGGGDGGLGDGSTD